MPDLWIPGQGERIPSWFQIFWFEFGKPYRLRLVTGIVTP